MNSKTRLYNFLKSRPGQFFSIAELMMITGLSKSVVNHHAHALLRNSSQFEKSIRYEWKEKAKAQRPIFVFRAKRENQLDRAA